MLTQAQARIQFVLWLKETHPALAAAAIDAAGNRSVNNGLGQFSFSDAVSSTAEKAADTGGSMWEKITSGALALGGTYLALKAQRDAMKINIARAEQGLPPIDAAAVAPVVRVQTDIDPQLAADLASNIGSKMNQGLLVIGGLALVAMLMMGGRKKR